MNCPKCKITKLEEKTFGALEGKEIKVDICFLCKAIWFDKSELEQTLKLKNKPVETKKYIKKNIAGIKDRDLKCPRCNVELIEIPSMRNMKIKMDVCEKCRGILLDCGELNNLQDGNYLQRFLKKILNFWYKFGIYQRMRSGPKDLDDLVDE